MQVQCAEECSETTICERRDDETCCVAQIFIAIIQRRVNHSGHHLFFLDVIAKLKKLFARINYFINLNKVLPDLTS